METEVNREIQLLQGISNAYFKYDENEGYPQHKHSLYDPDIADTLYQISKAKSKLLHSGLKLMSQTDFLL
ncbi:MAG: hypothetical protein U5P10_00710 [Spirochaetia bacterium]|nr:hypothetical protein [Spirochaetia bacterium]